MSPPKRNWIWIVVAGVLVVGALGGGAYFVVRAQRAAAAFAATGTPCNGGYDCHGGLCIRDDQENKPFAPGYCGNPCSDDADCPTGYICGLTRSGKRHACMVGER